MWPTREPEVRAGTVGLDGAAPSAVGRERTSAVIGGPRRARTGAWRDRPVGSRLVRFGSSSRRLAVAVFGPASVAAANAILQFVMVKDLPQAGFGLVAFVLGLTQFGYGLSNAFVGTPYTLDRDAAVRDVAARYGLANLVLSIAWSLMCSAAALTLGGDHAAPLFGGFASLAMIRWFGRSHLYARHRPSLVALSDLTYASVLLIGAASAEVWGLTLDAAMAILCTATLAGLLAVGPSFLRMQFVDVWRASLRGYGFIWRDQARWTLLGVVSSEATANAHAYAVALVAGPAAYAPLAAAALLVKPVMLVLTSLTQLERPVMARHILAGDAPGAGRAALAFRVAVLCAWAGTTALASVVLFEHPSSILRASYDHHTMKLAFALWAGIALLQCWATPPGVLLQAARWFKPLAFTQTRAALVTLAAVGSTVLLLSPVYTLCGILVGQVVMTVRVEALARRWSTASRLAGAPC